MLVLGQGALLVALLPSAWALLAGILGGVSGSRGMAKSAGRALIAAFLLLVLATLGLAHALLTDNFAVQYVADYSAKAQPLPYKISALWAGQGGSLMFWALLLAAFGAAMVLLAKREGIRDLMPWACSVIGGTLLFFTMVTIFAANPFVPTSGPAPPDGAGMNPLLQNFWMLIHPPTLYVGYVGCAVPFAFALAALFSRRLDRTWVRAMRRWSLFAFAFLTVGIWLGGYWAYIELGWGGFWAWDAVENASLMPWLVLTAFVHSIIVQDRRGVLKIWNMSLIIATFMLSVYGTYLTRSGIIQSVHAFNKSSIGYWFLGFLAVAGVVSVGFLLARLKDLKPDAQIESVVSRESTFLFGNLVLLGLTIMVFLLTMWPVISLLWSAHQIEMKPEQFTPPTRPFFLLLVLLMGVSPLVSWRRSTGALLARACAVPALVALAVVVALAALGAREPWSLAFFAVVVFVTGALVTDIGRMIRARREVTDETHGMSLARLLAVRRRRFGGYISHFAVVLMVVGIAGSMGYKKQQIFESVRPGQPLAIDGYSWTYEGFDLVNRPEYDGAQLRIAVTRPGGSTVTELRPEIRTYGRTRQPATEVAILSTLVPPSAAGVRRIGEDFYVIPRNLDPADGSASIEIIVHPMVNWLWAGGVLLLLGTVVAFWPDRRETEPATVVAPEPRAAGA